MLFPDKALFEYVLIDLADELAARPAVPIAPLPCDRWVARSCLQKAVRRGEVALAQRALANLYEYDRRSTWRTLAIVALEDVGVANLDVLARIVAAQRDRGWRQTVGGDWPVMAELVRQMAESAHCQAACDLLLRATNDPIMEAARANALESTIDVLAMGLWNTSAGLVARAIAALATGGALTDQQPHHDPCAVFDILSEASRSTHVVATCRSAWKLTGNPMVFLLPLVWDRWIGSEHIVADDQMPQVTMIGDVPGYALDQFTRIGNTISRDFVRSDDVLRPMLYDAGVHRGAHARTVGDLLFLTEGGLLANRAIWAGADSLRLPHRQLPAVSALGEKLEGLLAHTAAKGRQLAMLRQQHFIPSGG